jgi:hypothetical protein
MCIEKRHPRLVVRRQCKLLSLTRCGLYYRPVGESTETQQLMKLIHKQFLKPSVQLSQNALPKPRQVRRSLGYLPVSLVLLSPGYEDGSALNALPNVPQN